MEDRMKKTLHFIVLGLLALVGIALIYAYIAYPAEYVNRLLRWGEADVYDYQKFPERLLETSDTPFELPLALDEERVRTQFEVAPDIDDFDSFLADNRTQAFIVIQDDAIIYEQYFNGASRDSIVTSFSTAKSFASALIGIAISEGHIQSVDDSITDYLPELLDRDPAFGNITIRDLLMMSSGIRYHEFPFVNGDDAKTYYYPDLRKLALEHTFIVGQPSEKFLYNNYHPLLLGMIIERATGTSVTHYLQEKIWKPIGMEYPGSWSLDERGFEKMESGINARAIDFAKFGRLFVHNGNWNGVQVVPAEWVAESTQADTSVDYEKYYYDDFIFKDGRGYYKYMWWGIQRDGQNYDFIALGNHGQFVYISPRINLIIIRFGESYGEFGGAQGWVDLFYGFASTLDE
jgi:CubicO group peptidase (beta-lactamase class C family)